MLFQTELFDLLCSTVARCGPSDKQLKTFTLCTIRFLSVYSMKLMKHLFSLLVVERLRRFRTTAQKTDIVKDSCYS